MAGGAWRTKMLSRSVFFLFSVSRGSGASWNSWEVLMRPTKRWTPYESRARNHRLGRGRPCAEKIARGTGSPWRILAPVVDRILIVEDEFAVARGIQFALQQEGYEVAVARSGEEGLDFATTQAPDLIVLDADPLDEAALRAHVQALATEAGVAIENARLYRQTLE